MPKLKHLEINHCEQLEMMPQGIQHIQLQELLITDMPKDFIERLKVGGEVHPKIQHIQLVTLRHRDDEIDGFVTKVLSQ